jgi:uncharacterized protein YjbI with pentapeptide repeats
MANPEHVALVRKGAEAIRECQQAHPNERLDLTEADLSWANLRGANLREADFSDADLFEANLIGANLSGADLSGAKFHGANLRGANLPSANLSGASLFWADLPSANLSGASLTEAHLDAADLDGADLSEAYFALTSLSDIDLSKARGLGTARHLAPSSIGTDTLIASFRGAGNRLTPELRTFFRGAGVPQELLDALPTIVADIKYYSCFISYGQPDLELARKLDKDLRARGVSCWTYEMDKTPGERTWREIGSKRREADKMVLLSSSAALVRDGVLKEIEEQIDEDPDKVVPISLDDLWKERGFRVQRAERDLKPFLMERNYADFSNWDSDAARYDKALEELLKGLRREKPAD